MTINLRKGQRVNLSKDSKDLSKILIGLGWDPIKPQKRFGFFSRETQDFDIDIDASVLCIDENGKKCATVYYGNLDEFNRAIVHHGDNLTGDGDGDDEQIEVDLKRIPCNVTRLKIIINIYRANYRHQDFGQVKNCFVHVDDLNGGGRQLVRYDIDGDFNGKTGIFVGDLYRQNGAWNFQALGIGVETSGIEDMALQSTR